MTRAGLVSCGGDVFLASFIVKLFRERFYDELDSLYLCYNNSTETPKEVQGEFLSSIVDDPKIKLVYWPTQIGYGLPINKMLGVCDEELILLLEDDGFPFTSGKIKECFDKIESGEFDALGSPRFSCGTEISEALKQKYNLDYSGYGDVGPTFWPNFFFCKKSDLLKTDMNFAPKEFAKGVYYPELDHTMSETEYGDTFVWTSIQLRHLGLKIGSIPQFHCSPYEIEEKERGENNWINGSPHWLHGGSLSVGAGKYLKGVLPDVSNDIAKQEIETRVAWWTIISSSILGFSEYTLQYNSGISRLINDVDLDRERINKKIAIYRELLKI